MYGTMDLVYACENILGVAVVTAMRNANIGMPRIHDEAIKRAFIKNYNSIDAQILREAAIDLETYGRYNYCDIENKHYVHKVK